MFTTLRDGKMLLDNTIVRYQQKLIYIQEVVGDGPAFSLRIKYLSNGRIETIAYDPRSLDYSPVPLGNMNYQGDVYFCTRVPGRMNKQGLHKDAFRSFHYKRRYVRINLVTKSLIETVNNHYPDLKQVSVYLEKGMMAACAFSRHFSLSDDYRLWYNNRVHIGRVEPDLSDYHLSERYFYFKEHLKESLG